MTAKTIIELSAAVLLAAASACFAMAGGPRQNRTTPEDFPTARKHMNSLDMEFVRIEPGSFRMGFESHVLEPNIAAGKGQFNEGDFDEHPAHKAAISRPFYMGCHEVTNLQFELFDPLHRRYREKGPTGDDSAAVVNVSWYQASAFADWLADLEGLPYRLPTEAEWEYACRAGTTTAYNTGKELPDGFCQKDNNSLLVGESPPNAWGLYDMHGNAEEWVLDWYGPYGRSFEADPVGPAAGEFKVTRGGSRGTGVYYLRSANRLGTLPEDRHALIGFRLVIGRMPDTPPSPARPPQAYRQDVRQTHHSAKAPEETFFRIRRFLRMPEGNRGPLFEKHNHFTSVTNCPNGDLLAIWHTCISESGRELSVAGGRLRYDSDQWDVASVFWDAPDRNDHGHALWFDGNNTIYHFQGLATRTRNVALVLRTSTDNAVSWSKPRIVAAHGPSRMPIESVFRAANGAIVTVCDKGPTRLWISTDEGRSWQISDGDIRGKHAAVVQLADGRLMALGREGNIDGRMPMSVSKDMGSTWDYRASEFDPVKWGQRPVLLRLHEGALFFASFCRRMEVENAAGGKHLVSGLFAAVSFDEGRSWPCRRLVTVDGPGRDVATLNGFPVRLDPHTSEFAGYLAVCQTPDTLIHLLTSRQHYSFNLRWLKALPPAAAYEPAPPEPVVLAPKCRLPERYRPEPAKAFVVSAADGQLLVDTTSGGPVKLRSEEDDPFTAVDADKGYAVEIRTRIDANRSNGRGVDLELYDGRCGRYAITITENGLYWYDGYIVGTADLPFDQFSPLAKGLDNTGRMHTYRLSVRSDRVVHIYRDADLVGTKRYEYRTPRGPYIDIGADGGVKALIDYVSYDLSGPSAPR